MMAAIDEKRDGPEPLEESFMERVKRLRLKGNPEPQPDVNPPEPPPPESPRPSTDTGFNWTPKPTKRRDWKERQAGDDDED